MSLHCVLRTRTASSLVRIVSSSCPSLSSAYSIHSSVPLLKVKKTDKTKTRPSIAVPITSNNPLVEEALKEMNQVEEILESELSKHFSLQVDLRLYEDMIVKLEKGDEHKMSHLGRVSLKNPLMVMINFADNPSAIKWAKLAIQKSLLNVNPQHEGVVLYLPTPRWTRERREQLANDAKGKMYNEYKKALNNIYTKYDKKSSNTLSLDDAKNTRLSLLDKKRIMEARGNALIEARREALLKEVA